jgi:hypothetical protein
MHTSGTFTSLMGMGCSLNGAESVPETVHTYDVSRFTGIQFYAKGSPATPMLQAAIQTFETLGSGNGGGCLGAQCMTNLMFITLDPTSWTLYQIPFTMLVGGNASFMPKDAMTVEFLLYNNTGRSSITADYWIDDLMFY